MYGVAAWLCCAVGFPFLLAERSRKRPAPERLIPAHEGEWPKWFHWFKNFGVETCGADDHWWTMFFCFVTLFQAILIVVLITLAISLGTQ